ncbi:MAG: hypothetical protein HZB39_19725 [Planctomycetes bacterium]|nr:hypothetical protein [Planctomycetota bacterium]
MTVTLRIPVAAFLLGGALFAQAQELDSKSSGPLVGVPHALGVDGATCGLSRAQTWIKESGIRATLPVAPPAGGGPIPDFRIASIVGASVAAQIDVDAISIGLDIIEATSTGVLIPPPPPRIALISFSVTRGTLGAFGPVRSEALAFEGAAGDLFSFWTQAATVYSDHVDLAQDSPEIRIWCSALGDMDAHDLYIPLYQGPAWLLPFLTSEQQAFYFSVSNATLAACPTSWWAGTVPSGATVLWTTWTGGFWTPIRPFVTYDQIGLSAGDDLDALAIAPMFNPQPSRWMLFSTRSALPDPVMIYGTSPPLGPFVFRVRTPTGDVPLSNRLGLRGGGADDVDAISALDPEILAPPSYPNYGPGTPVASSMPWFFPTTGAITTAVSRSAIGFTFDLHGCTPCGCGPSDVGILLLNLGGTTTVLATFGFPLPLMRNTFQLTLPFVQPSPLPGFDVDAYWVRTNPTLTCIDAADPVRIHF